MTIFEDIDLPYLRHNTPRWQR